MFEAARTVHSHVNDTLSPRERRRVAEILRRSHGLPQNVTPHERDELRILARKLDLARLGRDLVPQVIRHQARHGRR